MAASKIDTKKVRMDLGTQSRVTINPAVVTEYAEAMERGEVFPPIKVYFDNEQKIFILVDGFHRYLAWIKTFPNDPILAEQVLGTVEEAVWESFSVNADHGLRRTNADKRRAVEGALRHPKTLNERIGDREIAKHCHVSHTFVQNMRKECDLSGNGCQIETRTVRRGEQVYEMQVGSKPRIVIGTDGIEYPKPDGPPPTLPWLTIPNPNANSHENYAEKLAECSGRKKNEFKRQYDVKDLKCSNCILYKLIDGVMQCACLAEPREPDALVCDEFNYCLPDVKVEPKPVENRPLDGGYLPEDADPNKLHRTYAQYADRDSIKITLPPKNPNLFVHELMRHFDREYLVTILPVLHKRLTEKDTDD